MSLWYKKIGRMQEKRIRNPFTDYPWVGVLYFLFSLVALLLTVPAFVCSKILLERYTENLSYIQLRVVQLYHNMVAVLMLMYVSILVLSLFYDRDSTRKQLRFWITTAVATTVCAGFVVPILCFVYIGNHERFYDIVRRLSGIRRRNYHLLLYTLFYNFFLILISTIAGIALMCFLCFYTSPTYYSLNSGNPCTSAVQLLFILGKLVSGK